MQILRITSDGYRRSYIWHSGDFIPALSYIVTVAPDGRVSFETPSLRNASREDLDVVIELLQECRREAERIAHGEVSFLSTAEAEAWLAAYRAELQQTDAAAANTLLSGGAHALTPGDVLRDLDQAIGQFGEYTLTDKGAHEVMDIAPIARALREMEAPIAAQFLADLLAHEHGGSVVSAVLGDLDGAPEAWWDALMAAWPGLQECY